MKKSHRLMGCLFFTLNSVLAFGQPIDQPTPSDVNAALKLLQKAAACNLKLDPGQEDHRFLIAAGGGTLEYYAAPDKPFKVLGLKSGKIDTYFDPTGQNPITITTYVHASLTTVKQTAKLDNPISTDIGILSARYSDSPGTIEIICTVSN